MDKLVIYHRGCPDGFCAAWLIWKYLDSDAKFKPVGYNDDPPTSSDVIGRWVYILDFSYDLQTMKRLDKESDYIVCLDHHESAENSLKDLDFCKFDMSKSGARLTWEYLKDIERVPRDAETPWLVNYTEDRDLWKWELPKSRQISQFIRSKSFNFKVWDEMHNGGWESAAHDGTILHTHQSKLVSNAVKPYKIGYTVIAGFEVPVVNATTDMSEIGNALADDMDTFAATFFINNLGKAVYSLRSRRDGSNVSKIAETYGGGGHPNASGFTVDELFPISPVKRYS